jgi:hypothetical protein
MNGSSAGFDEDASFAVLVNEGIVDRLFAAIAISSIWMDLFPSKDRCETGCVVEITFEVLNGTIKLVAMIIAPKQVKIRMDHTRNDFDRIDGLAMTGGRTSRLKFGAGNGPGSIC